MWMRDGRAEHELRIGQCSEFDRRIGLIEYRKLTFLDRVGGLQVAIHHCDPTGGGARRGLMAPALAGLELHNEIVETWRCINRTDGFATAAEQHARRAVRRHFICRKMLAERG